MADFCKACANDLGFPEGDLKGLTTPDEWADGRAAAVICEGCGYIQVDPDGNGVSDDCLRKGKEGHGLPKAHLT